MTFGGLRKKSVFLTSLDRQYEAAKQEWIRDHPEATPEQYEQAIRAIAQRLGY